MILKYPFNNSLLFNSPDWSLKLGCSLSPWILSLSESLLVSSTIYSFFPYGPTAATQYVYLAVVSLTSGSVSLRYKSNVVCAGLYGSGARGDFVVITAQCPSLSYLIVYNIKNASFTIKQFSGTVISDVSIEATTGR